MASTKSYRLPGHWDADQRSYTHTGGIERIRVYMHRGQWYGRAWFSDSDDESNRVVEGASLEDARDKAVAMFKEGGDQ